MSGLDSCGSKINTAGSFIDFFIHDVLDYSILENESSKFQKVNEAFLVKDVILVVIQMIEDKTKMKNIGIKTTFKDSSEDNFSMIKTDKKRLT